MPKRLLLFVLSVLLASSLSASSAAAYPPANSTSQRSQSSSKTTSKTVHVGTYTRKDGTVVQGYDRSAAGTKSKTTTPKPSSAAAASTERDSRGRIERNAAAKDEFERETGYPHGRKGYVVDHIKPLACGGADAPSNMQWQTTAEAKAKDKTERVGCK
jgi:hypothetical protein